MSIILPHNADETAWLRRRLERERNARQQAESLSEHGLRELYQRKEQLEVLEKIASAANQMQNAEDVLRFAIIEICNFSSWEVGHAYLVAQAAGATYLRSTQIWHVIGASTEPFRRATDDIDLKPGIGLPGRVLATGAAAWIRDVTRDGNFPRRKAASECGLRTASAFPVLSGDAVVAVVEFFARVTREPDETLLRLMSQIGMQIGRVIERERAAEISHRRAEELMHARDRAQAANRAKSEFLANMSHELRTPLNAIIGFSEVMMNEILGAHGVPAYRGYAKDVHDSGRHLLAVINDILDLSKIEAGKAELDGEEPIALAPLLDGITNAMRGQAEQKGIELDANTDRNLPRLIGSERMVRQILTNLLSNALKFTEIGGKVRVRAGQKESGEVVLSVEDTGIGMSAAEIALALVPFGQVESAFRRSHEGAGLGLSLARAMAELHQAQLRVASSPGLGTTIEVVFPPARVNSGEAVETQLGSSLGCLELLTGCGAS